MLDIQKPSRQVDPAQTDTYVQPNDCAALAAMTDQELQLAFEGLSTEIEDLRPRGALLAGRERLEWEIALLGAMYRRELIQFEQISRSIDHLDRSWAATRGRQRAFRLEAYV
jgi:hypothetical protein